MQTPALTTWPRRPARVLLFYAKIKNDAISGFGKPGNTAEGLVFKVPPYLQVKQVFGNLGQRAIVEREVEPVKETYAAAGVNIDLAAKAKELIGKHAGTTLCPEVLSGVGFFGGLYEFKGYN
ncbi:unnamed protein product, partial [marine sediment metagenome]